MKLEYQLTLNDCLEANQGHGKSQRFFLWIVSIVMTILGLICIIISPDEPMSYFCLLLGLFLIPFLDLRERHQVTSIWKSQPILQYPTIFEVNEERITVKNISFESHLKWQIYINFLETKNLFVLYETNSSFNILPKRAFISNEQLEQFRDLLRTNGIRTR
jgi:hypothetical protein